ncbi:dicer-like protein-like protein 1 [Macroventuria anomochaeta]|uniref:Dicer-like protein-like protein 1 n=1 Tax=Macroventuria anomochaeta TaxID=301207 RepID=A0ACB6RZU3_9PLEO|nr:dicer-like protein-like protein 1 [Macroventuria anomochaeta]KAF2626787.1 dicer-like protein-like protein 1 [Macroventuria anomochaeta]
MGWANVDEEQELDYYSCDDMSILDNDNKYVQQLDIRDPQLREGDGDDSDDSDDADNSRTHGPMTIPEKRRAQNDIFGAFAANISAHVTQREVDDAASRSATEEQLSIRDILAQRETTVRITNPRDYQTELFQTAKNGNTIAVLDTGSGKTHIATLLLKHVLDEELETRAKGGVHKTAFFLVDSVNLVFQQTNVLKCGLDQGVESVCGAMGASLWRRPTWDTLFAKNMVIVCTAEVLSQCLMHAFISMAQINLLIFDEAHHAKGNHPYAQIMKDYYLHESDKTRRPRLFGMTASPVDVGGLNPEDVVEAAANLETMLCSKIVTVDEATLAANNISPPSEEVVLYDRLQSELETPFHNKVKAQYGNVKAFRKFFVKSKQTGSELGRWASDMYWAFAFADEQARKLQQREEFHYNNLNRENVNVEELDAKIQRLKDAATFVQGHDFGTPCLGSVDLSSKVLKLHEWLSMYYERSDEPRCIVFVEQRQTTRLLKLIFDHIGGPNLRCDVLVGVNSRAGEHNVSLRAQILTLSKFRRGELNCIFATSVAEEGLDIPQCNLVIRFDLYRTMIAYVQSRGRARHRNSKYLHMLENGNNDHYERLMQVKLDETVMRNFCKGIARDRLLDDLDDADDLDAFEDKLYLSFVDPVSGAKLTYRSSLSVLNHFVATLPTPIHEMHLQPTYVISAEVNTDPRDAHRTGFRCEVILPECSPVISMIGKVESRKTVARCSAAFSMCLELHKKGFLDSNLLPTISKSLPAMRNAHLALGVKKKGNYPMLIKPEFWKQDRGSVPQHLYLTIVDVDAGLDRPHQPFGLLTRSRFPHMPSFPVYLTDGRASNVVSQSLAAPLAISQEVLELVTKFTLRIYEDIYNKIYEYDVQKMSYWVVPLLSSRCESPPQYPSFEDIVDMAQVRKVYEQPNWQWAPGTSDDDILDKFYSNSVATHLKPQDPKFMDSILDYSDSKWLRSRDVNRWHQNQPVLNVEKIPFRRNHLARVEDKEQEVLDSLKTVICPEPMRVSNVATPFVVMCYILPAIIHRFESYLIALEACKHIDLKVSPALALEALTKDSDNTDEHGEENTNFRSGMGPNYERLEFLGDCFLKMATSISTFVLQPDENEFEFHVRRMLMLCNANLMDTAVGKKKFKFADGEERGLQLYNYVRTGAFSRRTWYPEGLKLLRGKGVGKSEDDWLKLTHKLGDKSIADVCEAFIGATFMQHHHAGKWSPLDWDETVKAVKLFANSPDHPQSKWSDYYAAYTMPQYQIAESTATQLDLARKIEAKHPYKFKYPRLLRSAFVHPSQPFMWEQIPNYQRLEFLGDSLLDMVFIMHLFYAYPDKDPQWLTEHKTPMVSNKFLGAVCVKLGWHTHIRQNTATLSFQIRDYVTEVQEAEREANGAVDYWVGVSEPPKCLADVIEAYVAAIFVDSEFDFNVVKDFFEHHLKPYFEDMTLDAYDDFASNHPTTRLSRLLSINLGCNDWRMGALETETCIPGKGKTVAAMVMIHNKVVFHSLGQSGRYARVRASQAALEVLDGLPPYEFRSRYGCDCVDEGEGEMVTEEKEKAMKERIGLSI